MHTRTQIPSLRIYKKARYLQWVDFCLWFTRKNSINDKIGGVRELIGPWTLKSLNSIEQIQLRMVVATFNSNPSTKSSPATNVSEETDLIAF